MEVLAMTAISILNVNMWYYFCNHVGLFLSACNVNAHTCMCVGGSVFVCTQPQGCQVSSSVICHLKFPDRLFLRTWISAWLDRLNNGCRDLPFSLSQAESPSCYKHSSGFFFKKYITTFKIKRKPSIAGGLGGLRVQGHPWLQSEFKREKKNKETGTVANSCNTSSLEAEAKRPQVWVYTARPCLEVWWNGMKCFLISKDDGIRTLLWGLELEGWPSG